LLSPHDPHNPTAVHLALRKTVHQFSVAELEPQALEADEKELFNESLFRRLGSELNLFGITVSEKDGGRGLDPVATIIVCEELSGFDPGFCLSYLAHEILFVHNFYHNAIAEQRERYLPSVLSGSRIAAMAITEPEVGTDVLGMRTIAEKKGDHYVLSGTKQFMTNGSPGDLFIIYAKCAPKSKAISAFIVESGFKGFNVGKKEKKLGMRSSPTTQIILENCEVPRENLLGRENHALIPMMCILDFERLALAALSTGIALRCFEEMGRHAISERSALGQRLFDVGQIQRSIAESYAEIQAARALVYEVAQKINLKAHQGLGASSAKLIASRTAEQVAHRAVHALGGYGSPHEYSVARFLRDAILLSIGGGTNEALQNYIAHNLIRFFT
jgi:isovaleryl-CoA dehydrogenase